jgi:hypothetical protein
VTRQTATTSLGPGHDRPERARGCLLTGKAAAAAAAHYAHDRPRLDETSRRVIESADRPPAPSADSGPAGSPGTAHAWETAGTALWLVRCQAPMAGPGVTGLVRTTGSKRAKLDPHRRQYAGADRAIGASGRRWRARAPGRSL